MCRICAFQKNQRISDNALVIVLCLDFAGSFEKRRSLLFSLIPFGFLGNVPRSISFIN